VESRPSKSGLRIAVVDDEESVCRALERLLRSVGFEVETFGSGAAFLESRGRWRADCVVVDVHMPGVSGCDVQARLTDAAQDVPVVVITGRDTDEARDRAMVAGAAAYLRKPVDDQTLLSTLAAALARGRKARRPPGG
jgi:FixJ family two-component response regulator